MVVVDSVTVGSTDSIGRGDTRAAAAAEIRPGGGDYRGGGGRTAIAVHLVRIGTSGAAALVASLGRAGTKAARRCEDAADTIASGICGAAAE